MKASSLFICFLFYALSFSQVGIGTNDPVTTLDVRAQNHNGALVSSDGVLVPRVQTIGVSGVEPGQLIYLTQDDTANNYTKGFHFWDGSNWSTVGSEGGSVASGNGVYTTYWYIGNVTSSQTSISNITGDVDSVVHVAAQSSGTQSTYDIYFDQPYLTGQIGSDFQVVSELTTDRTTSARNSDSRIHRVVQKLTNNILRISLWNINSNSSNMTGVMVSVIRGSNPGTLSTRGQNLGVFHQFSDLTTAYPSPTTEDNATISSYEASISHIAGISVPVGEEEYYIYRTDTGWVYIGWANSVGTLGNWISDGPIQITAATTDPVKPASLEVDLVRYRELPYDWVEVEMRYVADSRTGADDGSGHYYFSLPTGFSLDTLEHPLYTGSGVSSNSIAAGFTLPVDQGITSQRSTTGSEALMIPFTDTTFRVLCFSGSPTGNYISSSFYDLFIDNKVFYFRFRFKKQ